MIDLKQVQQALRDKYNAPGMTQQQLADEAGMSRSYIAELISGKCAVDGLTLKKVNQLFPDAVLSLGNRSIGDGNVIHRHARVQSDNNFLPVDEGSAEVFRRSLIDTIIASEEISDEERGKFLRIIRGVGK